MLINPEDGRADNYMLEPFERDGKTFYRLISIDNDHAFVQPLKIDKKGEELAGPPGLQVKTILYCLEEMQSALHVKVRERLLSLKPYEFLKGWIESLEQQQVHLHRLFDEKERQQQKDNKIDLEILFKPSVIVDVYQKLMCLQSILSKKPEMPLLSILRRVIPNLGVRYQTTFAQYETPQARFDALTEGCFDKQVVVVKSPSSSPDGFAVKREITMSRTTMGQVIEMTRDLAAEEKHKAEEIAATPAIALKHLQTIHEEHSKLSVIRDELQKGNVKPFLQLSSTDYKEWIVNGKGIELPGIDFSEIRFPDGKPDLKRQNIVLEALQGIIPFKMLRLRHCGVLTDRSLIGLLKTSPGLLALELQDCDKLTEASLSFIEKHCSSLEKLSLMNINFETVSIKLPRLRILTLEGSLQLVNLKIMAPQLCRLMLANNPKLSKLTVKAGHITKLNLNGCVSLSTAFKAFYEKYPFLLWLPSEMLSVRFTQSFDEMFEKMLIENKLSLNMTPLSLSEQMQQDLIDWLTFIKAQMLPALLQMLKDKEGDVRKMAAYALGQLNLPEANVVEVVSQLLQMLEDKEGDVRSAAAEALGKSTLSSESVTQILPELLQALKDEEWEVRITAAETLSKLNWPSDSITQILPELLQMLKDKDSQVRVNAAETLGKLNWPSESITQILPELLHMLKDKEGYVRIKTAGALRKLILSSEGVAQILPELLQMLKDKKRWDFRAEAAVALSKLTLSPENITQVLPELLQMLKDKDSQVRAKAVEALGKLTLSPENVTQVLPELLQMLEDKEGYVRSATAEALGKLTLPLESVTQVLPEFLQVLKGEYGDLRPVFGPVTAAALGKLNWPSESITQVLPELLQMLKDKEGYVRSAAVGALNKLILSPENVTQVLPQLLQALKDESGLIRATATEALGKSTLSLESVTQILPELLQMLKDKEGYVRIKAAEGLGKLTLSAERLVQVVSALLQMLKDKESDVRSAAAKALGTLGSIEYYINQLIKWLKDALLKEKKLQENTAVSKIIEIHQDIRTSKNGPNPDQLLASKLVEKKEDGEVKERREAGTQDYAANLSALEQDFQHLASSRAMGMERQESSFATSVHWASPSLSDYTSFTAASLRSSSCASNSSSVSSAYPSANATHSAFSSALLSVSTSSSSASFNSTTSEPMPTTSALGSLSASESASAASTIKPKKKRVAWTE